MQIEILPCPTCGRRDCQIGMCSRTVPEWIPAPGWIDRALVRIAYESDAWPQWMKREFENRK